MNIDVTLPGRLLRHAGAPKPVTTFQGVQIDDPRLAEILSPDARLLCPYEGTLHGEGPVWQPARSRLLWSDVANRRLRRRPSVPTARSAAMACAACSLPRPDCCWRYLTG
jgi:hypothetical protein